MSILKAFTDAIDRAVKSTSTKKLLVQVVLVNLLVVQVIIKILQKILTLNMPKRLQV